MFKNLIKKSFNKTAHQYDLHADLQKKVGKELLTLIKHYGVHYPHILDVGSGTGLITHTFASELHYKTFHAIDIAELCVEQAKKVLREFPIYVYMADFDEYAFDTSFDLIYSNMSLHWSTRFLNTLQNLSHLLYKKGIFAFTIPLHETFHELSPYVQFNQFYDENEIVSTLSPFKILHCENKIIKKPFASLLEALQSIKNIGANQHKGKPKGLLPNKFLQELLRDRTHSLNNQVSLTYKIGFFIIERP